MVQFRSSRSLFSRLASAAPQFHVPPMVEAIYAPGEAVTAGECGSSCIFIENGLVSLHVIVGGHLSGSVGLIGQGGLIGVPSLLGFSTPVHQGMAVTRATGFAIEAARLRSCLVQLPELRNAVASYVSFRFAQALVSSACNLEHGLGPRLADWIMLASTLLDEKTIPVTHDRLAVILGATRPSVTLALQSLEEQKAIRSRRGHIDVLDGERLSAHACRCASSAVWNPPRG